jgi:PEGA domain
MIANFRTLATLGLLAASSLFAQQTGYLKTKVDPGRAGVFVDGKYLGPACNFGVARKYSLAAGEHKIKLVEPRYEDLETSVTVQAGKTAEIKQTMKALPAPKGPFGMLHTWSADKFAAVYVNDHFMGHAGEFNNSWQALKLPVGEYTVRIEPPTGQAVTQKVKIEADKSVMVK